MLVDRFPRTDWYGAWLRLDPLQPTEDVAAMAQAALETELWGQLDYRQRAPLQLWNAPPRLLALASSEKLARSDAFAQGCQSIQDHLRGSALTCEFLSPRADSFRKQNVQVANVDVPETTIGVLEALLQDVANEALGPPGAARSDRRRALETATHLHGLLAPTRAQDAVRHLVASGRGLALCSLGSALHGMGGHMIAARCFALLGDRDAAASRMESAEFCLEDMWVDVLYNSAFASRYRDCGLSPRG